MNFILHQATNIGRTHLLEYKNRQDACTIFNGLVFNRPIAIGVVCDGCSEGSNSEVGAQIGVSFLIRDTRSLLDMGVPVRVIPNILYQRLIEFLRQLVDGYNLESPVERANFVKNNLLFTVVGFIVTKETSVIFFAGDGTIVIDDLVRHLESNNLPIYPGYHLIDRNLLVNPSPLPNTFDTLPLITKQFKRLAIGSDAWKDESDLLKEIWGYKHPAGLQRKLNQWSKTDKRFKDDVTIITLEILESQEGASDASDSRRNQDPPQSS